MASGFCIKYSILNTSPVLTLPFFNFGKVIAAPGIVSLGLGSQHLNYCLTHDGRYLQAGNISSSVVEYALISVQDILILYKYSQTSAFKNLMELAKNIKFYRMTIATHTSVCFSSVSMFCVTNISLLRLRGSIKIKLLRGFSLAE